MASDSDREARRAERERRRALRQSPGGERTTAAAPAAARRRRLRGLALVAAAAAVIGAAVGSGDGGDDESASTASSLPADCSQPGPAGIRRAAGQMVMVRMEATADRGLRRAAARGEIGGVVLFPPPDADNGSVSGAVERLQASAAAGGRPPLLVAADQEGGEVKRFLDAPPTLSPGEMDANGGEQEAEDQGEDTGRFLAGLGVNVDLAPVLDVPATEDSFLGTRTFGSDPETVTRLGLAFARGLDAAGVAATAKHFPGLGSAPTNTDFSPSLVNAPRPALRAGLKPFEQAIAAEIPLIMLAHAAYPAFGSKRPASLDRGVVTGRLRERLGFEGVTITDDLGAGAVAAEFSPKDAAVEAVQAGDDILLFAQASEPTAVEAIAEAVAARRLEAAPVRQACGRIATLKDSLGV